MNNTWSLDDLYRSIERQWRTVLTIAAVALGIAVGASLLWPDRYSATAVMTVEPITVQSVAGGEVNMNTEAVVATSTEVLARAVDELPGTTVGQLQESIEVVVPRGADVLEFTFIAADPATAADSANAIAIAYRDQRVANAQRVLDEANENLATRISELTTRIGSLDATDPARGSLQAQGESLQAQQANLDSSILYSGLLVSPAVAPADSTKPSLLVFIAAGLFLGAFLGVFVALARARLAESAPSRSRTAHSRPRGPAPADRIPLERGGRRGLTDQA